MKSFGRNCPLPVIAALLLYAGPASSAETGIDFFAEEAKVLTASRRMESAESAPMSVDVITEDEIRDSGAVNIWDLLRFRVGMDVIDARSGEGNRAIVSVSGFPAEFVDKLLVLVDGRSVYTGLSGGAVWDHFPAQLHEIDRIEIVRGPNAAMYGSNAGLGVINIMTKRPSTESGAEADAVVGNRGLNVQHVAAQHEGDASGYRLSVTRHEDDGMTKTGHSDANDFLQSWKANLRGFWKPSARGELEYFAGGSMQTAGVQDLADTQGRFHHHFQMLRHNQKFGRSSVQVMASRRDDQREYEPTAMGTISVREYQYDAEVVFQTDWTDRLQTTYGGNYRYNGIESHQIFGSSPRFKNALRRGFASAAWTPRSRLRLIGAISHEHSDTGGTEPAVQVAAIAEPMDRHFVRASYALAPTIPTAYAQASNQRTDPDVVIVGNSQIRPQRLRTYELAYYGHTARRTWTWETVAFYTQISDLGGAVVRSFTPSPDPLLTLTFENNNSAIARGTETTVKYRRGRAFKAYINHTYESVSDAKGDTNAVSGVPSHKVNVGGTARSNKGVSLTINAGYKSSYRIYSQVGEAAIDIRPYWRLDARVGYELTPDVTLFLAGQNLAEERHAEFSEGLEIRRTYLGGVSVAFGRT